MNNIRIFEVGGSIRDELMGIENPSDRDFCAVSPEGWEALLTWCKTNMDKVFLVTPEFFTIRGMIGKDAIDIVMCRIDGTSSDGRHPDLVKSGTLMDDLARRDFTVNALAREVDPKTLKPVGEIIDPHMGFEDLKDNTLRCVGDTNTRLEEDGLRILRAARFAVTKGFNLDEELAIALRDETWWAFVERTVSEERIREELTKMFAHDTVKTMRFLMLEASFGAVDFLFGNTTSVWLKPTSERKR